MSDWQHIPYLFITAVAALLSLAVAAYVYRRRAAPGGMHFTLLMCAVGLWALANTGEFLSQTIWLKIFWSKVSYVGILSVAPLWLLFCLSYAHPDSTWLGRRSSILWLLPAFLLILVFSNEAHGLVWPRIVPLHTDPNLLVRYDHGIGFWFAIGYIYLLLLLGTVLLLRAVLRSTQLFRMQIALLLLAMFLPWLGNLLYVTRLVRWADQDLTPLGFALSGIAVALGMFRYHMLDIVPIARGQLIESMSDGVLVLDNQNRILDVNPAAAGMLGGDLVTYIGAYAEDALRLPQDMLKRYRKTSEVREEIQIGETNWYDLRISTLKGRKSNRGGRLVLFRDITARKLAELELRRYAAELEAGNAELDAFAHTVAHDLRNPLSIILGFSDALRNYGHLLSEDEKGQHLEFIGDSARKMQGIIDALLLLASVRRSEDIPFVPLDMSAIVAEVRSRLSVRIVERNALIAMPDAWPLVAGYPVWLENVWINYIGNALKYGVPNDGASMEVRLGWDREGNDASHPCMIRFWVQDNGQGLVPEQCERLFTPFTRLHLDEPEGHGLGLSIVERIVTRLGGAVGVSSVPGEGSRFWFTLPELTEASDGSPESVPASPLASS